MEAFSHAQTTSRARGNDISGGSRRGGHRNRQWVAGETNGGARNGHGESERWDRGGHRGGGRGTRGASRGLPTSRKFPNATLRITHPTPNVFGNNGNTNVAERDEQHDTHGAFEEEDAYEVEDHPADTPEERERFYQELVKAREVEKKRAIAEGKMDDPLVPKRLEDAISMVGTCMDMCPRYERYRRERENNLFQWETIPGTKRVDHRRAVKMYERAAGDKTLPSDLRPPHVLKMTLDYLFHDLLPRGGFSPTFDFIRDRSRAVRNDFTMQHVTGPLAIECHDRCARFHILAIHFERARSGFSIALEEQQLMNTLQSLKEFYEDQRGRYSSPNELEMRVYHRLIHIRDQKERHEDVPEHITSHPVFKLTTDFRLHVQRKSAPISKTSTLVVDAEGMQIFGKLASVLREQGSVVMIYLVACILERLFGVDAIDDIEGIRGDLSIPDIIDGISTRVDDEAEGDEGEGEDEAMADELDEEEDEPQVVSVITPAAAASSSPALTFGSGPAVTSAFATAPVFGTTGTSSWFGTSRTTNTTSAPVSAFSAIKTTPNPFGTTFSTTPPVATSAFTTGSSTSVFGNKDSSTAAESTKPVQPPSSNVFGVSSMGSSATSAISSPAAFPVSSSSTSTSTSTNFFNTKPANPLPSASAHPAPVFGSRPFGTSAFNTKPLFSSPLASAPPLGGSESSLSQGNTTAITNGAFSKPSHSAAPQTAVPSLNPLAAAFTPTSMPNATVTGTSTNNNVFATSNHAAAGFAPSVASASQVQRSNGFPPASSPTPTIPPPLSLPPSLSFAPSVGSKADPSPSPRESSGFQHRRTSTSGTTPPALPKINTNTNTSSFFNVNVPPTNVPPTPTEPPQLARQQPISLPSTPTTAATQPPPTPLRGLFKNGSSSSIGADGEMLSPLYLSTPVTSRPPSLQNFGEPKKTLEVNGNGTSKRSTSGLGLSGTKAPVNGAPPANPTASKSKPDKKTREALRAKALAFARKGLAVKQCFNLWQKRTTDRAAWIEACHHSEDYRKKIRSQGSPNTSTSKANKTSTSSKKRRVSASTANSLAREASPSKRARKRVSSEYRPPRTDDELAQRFRENHEEHERRWAQGSFIQVIRDYVESKRKPRSSPGWGIYLSMNSENDGTAIWLERKFDVPNSGRWESETIFSVPLSIGETSYYPGVIVFECTPLDEITDELEKKYRVLDDCARLRDVIEALPTDRRFIPSLLVISWTEDMVAGLTSDLNDMIKNLVEEEVLESYCVFALTSTTKDLDRKFGEALQSLHLDVDGKLVRSLPLRGVFKSFEPLFNLFVSDWIESCCASEEFNWILFGRVIQACITLLNGIARSVLLLISVDPGAKILPGLDADDISSSDSAYNAVLSWLTTVKSSNAANAISADLQGYLAIGADFPTRTFLEQLLELTRLQAESRVGKRPTTEFLVLKVDIALSLENFQRAIQNHAVKLEHAQALSIRRSPKRRGSSENSGSSKRRRLSDPVTSPEINGNRSLTSSPPTNPTNNSESSPSPSASHAHASPPTEPPTSTSTPLVTIAMLRALTRDVKERYGSGKRL